jgi:hypothetical protein
MRRREREGERDETATATEAVCVFSSVIDARSTCNGHWFNRVPGANLGIVCSYDVRNEVREPCHVSGSQNVQTVCVCVSWGVSV